MCWNKRQSHSEALVVGNAIAQVWTACGCGQTSVGAFQLQTSNLQTSSLTFSCIWVSFYNCWCSAYRSRGFHGWRSHQTAVTGQRAVPTCIHSVIWARDSGVSHVLSGYIAAPDREGLLLTPDNENHYLAARWMWLILLSGIWDKAQSWSWALLRWFWGHDASWDGPGAAHST